MYGYIYETTNLINGKKYIGKHKSSSFDNNYYGSGIKFSKALKECGKDNFSVRILEECNSLEELNKKETYYIELFDAVRSSRYYNNSYGGENEGWECINKIYKENPTKSPMYNKHHTEETKKKISESCRGKTGNTAILGRVAINNGVHIKYVYLEELNSYLNNGWIRGRLPMSDEVKAKISKSSKGKKVSKETRIKMSASLKGKKSWNEGLTKYNNSSLEIVSQKARLHRHTEETKAKISKSHLLKRKEQNNEIE